ncbi:MAG: serine/threonine protein kinase [Pseudomonadota bacterium]
MVTHESSQRQRLKSDTFGAIWRVRTGAETRIQRDLSSARPWAAWLARRLALREARALGRLRGLRGFPQLYAVQRDGLTRSFLEGQPMFEARPTDADWFIDALRLLRRMHRAGVTHNDLAKEPNWLVTDTGRAAIVDFQLASTFKKRSRWFRVLAHDDLRHLLKHKRTYRPEALTARQRRILATPAWPSRVWRATGKPVYLFITRRLLNWSDREGAADRGRD